MSAERISPFDSVNASGATPITVKGTLFKKMVRPDDAGIRDEIGAPQLVAQNHYCVAARHLVFVGPESPPQFQRHIQYAKEIAAYQLAEPHLRQRAFFGGESELRVLGGRQTRIGLVTVMEVNEIRIGQSGVLGDPADGLAAQLRLNHDDLGSMRHGQRPANPGLFRRVRKA